MQAEMNRLRNELDRAFGRFNGGARQASGPSEYPPVNLWEDDEKLFVEAELPGMNLDDLEVYVTGNNQLTISGERKEPEGIGGGWHRRERGYGKFTRVIELPSAVANDQVAAAFRSGVLTITLPKREEARPRRIPVRAD
jgi:HSP20 family protein